MQSSTTGTKEADAYLAKVLGTLNKSIPNALQDGVNEMVTRARKNHKFKRKSGQAERAIQGYISKKEWSLTFWINPAQVTVYSKDGKPYNYAWGLNDGTRSNYKTGHISPTITPSPKSGGIHADDFMNRAWQFGRRKMKKVIKSEIERAFK